MAVKTITITECAYETLKRMKESNESFSEAILRIGKRRSLGDFFGILDKKSGERFEKEVLRARKIRNKVHNLRLKTVLGELANGDS
ncbi:antitoxin VapB family protein [Candidatus Woesearchaeota archaeon]|nr:antitoxin VapB family protein [Candidatus Woesearchaeota archaeon]